MDSVPRPSAPVPIRRPAIIPEIQTVSVYETTAQEDHPHSPVETWLGCLLVVPQPRPAPAGPGFSTPLGLPASTAWKVTVNAHAQRTLLHPGQRPFSCFAPTCPCCGTNSLSALTVFTCLLRAGFPNTFLVSVNDLVLEQWRRRDRRT